MSWTAAQPSNHHFPRTHIQDEKGSSNCCHMPWATALPHQKREAENVNSNVKVGGLGKHTEQLRREGELGPLGCLSTTNHLVSYLSSPQAFSSTLTQENLEAALMEAPSHSCVCVLTPSALAEHNKEREKTTQIPPKSASSIFSAISLTAKHPARAAAAHQPVFLCCFSREKYMGLKKIKSPVANML